MNDGLVDVTLAGLTKQVMLSRKLPRLFLQTRWLFVPNRLGELVLRKFFVQPRICERPPLFSCCRSEVRTSSRSARSWRLLAATSRRETRARSLDRARD